MFPIILQAVGGLSFLIIAIAMFSVKPKPMLGWGDSWNRLMSIIIALAAAAVATFFAAKAYYLYTLPEDIQLQDYFDKLWHIALSLYGGLTMLYYCYHQYYKEPIEISWGREPNILLKRGISGGLALAMGIVCLGIFAVRIALFVQVYIL